MHRTVRIIVRSLESGGLATDEQPRDVAYLQHTAFALALERRQPVALP